MRDKDGLVKLLSLIFSIYSPLYVAKVAVVYLVQRKTKWILFPLLLALVVWLDAIHQFGIGDVILVGFASLVGLDVAWTKIIRMDYLNGSIYAYPIHPLLYGRVGKLTGYHANGRKMYELHIDPRLDKSIGGLNTGRRVARDSKQVSERLRGATAVGTTYEGKLMMVASQFTGDSIERMIRLENTRPWCESALFPRKKWDTFVWEFSRQIP